MTTIDVCDLSYIDGKLSSVMSSSIALSLNLSIEFSVCLLKNPSSGLLIEHGSIELLCVIIIVVVVALHAMVVTPCERNSCKNENILNEIRNRANQLVLKNIYCTKNILSV